MDQPPCHTREQRNYGSRKAAQRQHNPHRQAHPAPRSQQTNTQRAQRGNQQRAAPNTRGGTIAAKLLPHKASGGSYRAHTHGGTKREVRLAHRAYRSMQASQKHSTERGSRSARSAGAHINRQAHPAPRSQQTNTQRAQRGNQQRAAPNTRGGTIAAKLLPHKASGGSYRAHTHGGTKREVRLAHRAYRSMQASQKHSTERGSRCAHAHRAQPTLSQAQLHPTGGGKLKNGVYRNPISTLTQAKARAQYTGCVKHLKSTPHWRYPPGIARYPRPHSHRTATIRAQRKRAECMAVAPRCSVSCIAERTHAHPWSTDKTSPTYTHTNQTVRQ